jgi:starch-binding outer membrane protein, SusD/RagB family
MKPTFFKYFIMTLVASFVLHLSCNKKTIELSPRGPSEAVFFSTEGEFTRAVLGVYAKMTDLYGYISPAGAGAGSMLAPIFFLMGDDITSLDNGEEFELFNQLQPSSGRVTAFYRVLYQMLGRANVVLQKLDEEDGVYTTAGLKDIHRGEALFLRGFVNYYLWNYFGTAPLVNERVTSETQFFAPSSSGTQLLDQAILDLTEAAQLLPASWDAANSGRVTKNSAFGLLGKCQVFRASAANQPSDYTAAITSFNSITGASLTADFGDNFAIDAENNNESLFEFQAGTSDGNNQWLDNDFGNATGNLAAAWNYYTGDELYESYRRFQVTDKLSGAFEAGDPRRELTFNPGPGTVNGIPEKMITKYVLRNERANGQPISRDNYRILRLADVKLLEAEALVQSNGSTADAIALVNEIRTRARNMSGGSVPANYNTGETNRVTIMAWIMNERFIELAGEGQRWLDIRRWDLQGLIDLNSAFFNGTGSVSFNNPKHLLLPIPNAERDVNPNVQQNPGY